MIAKHDRVKTAHGEGVVIDARPLTDGDLIEVQHDGHDHEVTVVYRVNHYVNERGMTRANVTFGNRHGMMTVLESGGR